MQALFFYTVPFLAVLTIVVFVHELGHFLVGRWCGARVDAFSIGFGPELFHFVDRRGTRWRLAALPLGGYVKFHGDANAASVPDQQAIDTMAPEDRAGALASLSVWRRAAIVAAGPAANFLLAIVILAGIFFTQGKPIFHPQVLGMIPGGAAATSELKVGDVIVGIDGRPIEEVEQVQQFVRGSASGPIALTIERAGTPKTILIDPKRQVTRSWLGEERSASLGIQIGAPKGPVEMRRYSLPGAVWAGTEEVAGIVATTGRTIRGLIIGRESARQLSGPIGIAQVSGEVAQAGVVPLTYLLAILSVSIGLLNLLPIPLLDGGFLLFFAYEAIRGRALPERAQMIGFRLGLTFVAVLSVFVAMNDIGRILFPPSQGPAAHAPAPQSQKDK